MSHRSSMECLEPRRLLATFTVTTAADAGAGSLRAQIAAANTAAGADVIQFAIGTGQQSIGLSSVLPGSSGPLTISGNTQPGYAGVPLIRIDGSAIPVGVSSRVGIDVLAGAVEVRGLCLVGFDTGVRMVGNSSTVRNCYLGVQRDGITRGAMNVGVLVVSGNTNHIGVTGNGNLIGFGTASVPGAGVRLLGGSGSDVIGNKIGTNAAGSAATGCFGDGVSVEGSTNTLIGASSVGSFSNVIAGIGGNGVALKSGLATVSYNGIGILADGFTTSPNAFDGVAVTGGTHQITHNGIQGNGGAGISVTANAIAEIFDNGISRNGGLGIDLGAVGVTPNDAGDVDTGPNNLQNYPTNLTARLVAENTIRLRGRLDTTASSVAFLDFYISNFNVADPSGFGEGEFFYDTTSVTTNAAGTVLIDRTLGGFEPLEYASITASIGGATSEFSPAARVFRPGDLNGDVSVNNADIAPFVQALTNPAAYVTAHPDIPIGPYGAGDINDDGAFNNLDISAFVALLTVPRLVAMPLPVGAPVSGSHRTAHAAADVLGFAGEKFVLA